MITIEYDVWHPEVKVNDISEAEKEVVCLCNGSDFEDLVIYDDDLNEYEVEWIAKITPTGEKVIL
jgi:hypothetical protein